MKRLLKGSLAIASAAVIFAGNMPFTAVNVLADSNETEVIPSIDNTVYTGTWGTCNWTYDNGILTISGGVAEGSKSWDSYKNNIEKIVITGKITFNKETSLYGLFSKMTSLKTIEGLSNLDTSKVTDMDSMFRDCSSLETLDVSGFDTSRVTDMSGMFYECNSLTTLDVSHFDTSKVTRMGSMFHGCSSLETLDVSGFDTSRVTDMDGMFYECRKLQIIDVSKFDTSKVKSMGFMFSYCEGVKTIDVSNFNTENVTIMCNMFQSASQCEVLDVKNFNTSRVTRMDGMFSGCKSITSLDVSNFDTSNVTDMNTMFQSIQCEELDLKNFDTSKVTNMKYMFGNTKSLKELDVSSFNTSNVTDMSNMFYLCYKLYNLDISGFDMSKVTKMTEMFNGASLVTIKVPSKLSEDRDTFLKEMKSGMRSGKWIDETANINYDNKASVELSEGHSYKFNPGKMYVMLNMTNTTEGKELAASVKGGAYDYTYKFIMYNPSADKWTLLSDYSSSRSYILNMKGNGERKIYVDVKDALGNVVRTSKTITLTGQEPLTVEASKNETDKQVTFTANATGGSSDYTYKFIVYNKTTGTWGIVQNYSDKNTCTWTKGSAGDRDFYVDVKDSDGNVVRSKAMNVKIESNKPTAVLTPSATVLSTGDKLTLTASTDKTGCTYKFLIYNPATNQWFKLQDFSSKNTCTWTAGSNGTRQFYVDVKDASGNVTRSKVVNVTIGGEGALSVKTTVSANTTKVGDKITFSAEGAGGKAGYTYKMVVYNKTTKTWGLVQNFNANNKITWTAGSAGDRDFYIDVKDADGKVVRSSVMNVKTSN